MAREIWNMNLDWKFHEGDIAERNFNAIHQERYINSQWIKSGNNGVAKWGYDDTAWRLVQVPHDFVLERSAYSEAVPASHGSLVKGIGWYRKSFELPAEDEGKCLRLEFDGVFRDCSVWLNGHFLGRHLSGYTSFSYDITDVACYGGPNVVAVRADATEFEGWWYEGGGIYRDVRLVKTHRLHVPQWGTCVTSELNETHTSAVVTLETEVHNDELHDVTFELVTVLIDPQGRTVCEVQTTAVIASEERLVLKQDAEVELPILWSVDAPHLYTAHTMLRQAGVVVDSYDTPFGIRSIRFDPQQGFLLNGKPVKLKGVCCHEDHAGVGMALPAAVHEFRIQRLKEMGGNAYRTSHNPPTPALLEACDRLGMLVIDEVRFTETSEEALEQLRSLIKRDRNHPSVILWSLGNEEMGIQGREVGVRIMSRMQRLAHKLDPTRACTYGMNGDWLPMTEFHEQHGFHLDVHGFNYMMRRNWNAYDQFRERFPDQGCIGSENASTLSTRGLYKEEHSEPPLVLSEHANQLCIWSNPKRQGIVSGYGETYPVWGAQPEEAWKAAAERPYVAGLFVWTGFDYRGETFPYEYPSVLSRYGIMDFCGFAKDIFYYYKARWTEEPVLHVFPHWDWAGNEGEVIDVWAFTNMDEVELFLNGQSLGKQIVPPHGHPEWQVPYAQGRLTAKGYTNGALVVTTDIETTTGAAKLELRSARFDLTADHEDVGIVEVRVVDASGRLVPGADHEIVFSLEGPGKLIGTGNGNPVSREEDKKPQRKAYHGLCQVLVQTTDEAGELRLMAKSPGLASAELVLRSVQAEDAAGVRFVPSIGLADEDVLHVVGRLDAADGGV
ncbi:beta-galactosidase GalA [Paenibacillus sp. YYML68]|uniref:beta-galactosidase GalA n=1 Tax=Paenibacillus sp. YYML68 TaxID=2909250 RepID=UPI00249026CE|nr:beta-galactosidase GalA [Paenibacillus sp. YYML68]